MAIGKITRILGAFLLFSGAPAYALDWSEEDTERQLIFYGLKVMDWRQTLSVKNDSHLAESNTLLGSHPSDMRIHKFMMGGMLLETGIAAYLEPESRAYFQYVMIGFTGFTVASNWRVGAKWGF